jgi:hypothetical protein
VCVIGQKFLGWDQDIDGDIAAEIVMVYGAFHDDKSRWILIWRHSDKKKYVRIVSHFNSYLPQYRTT